MTAICGGGTSGPKAGTSGVVLVGSGVIATMMQRSGNLWLAFASSLLTLPELVLSVFCATDPPAMPTFTTAESSALLNVTLGADFTTGLSKFADLVANLAWQEYCECTSGALIIPPPVAPPAGTPIYQAPSPGQVQPCFTISSGAGLYFAGNGSSFAFAGGSNPSPLSGVTAIRITATGHVAPSPGHQYSFSIFGSSDGGVGTAIGSSHVFPVTGTDYTIISNPNPDYRYFYANLLGFGTSAGFTDLDSITFDLFCGGALPGTQQACCPPDVATQSSLDLILKMVTLIQRQIAPFAYVPRAVHTGISGNGQIAVAGLLGVAVDVTTLPSRAGRTSGNPLDLYDVGWINAGTADGWGPRQFISSDPFILRPISGDVTLIGYSIPADVVVTITELVREP
jgi:hypothetical protein